MNRRDVASAQLTASRRPVLITRPIDLHRCTSPTASVPFHAKIRHFRRAPLQAKRTAKPCHNLAVGCPATRLPLPTDSAPDPSLRPTRTGKLAF